MTTTLQAELSSQACYVITEYFPSPQQLASTETNITRQQALHLALQLAQTLDQLHKAGLVHGGIEYSALDFRAPDRIALRPVMLQRALSVLRPDAIKSLGAEHRRYVAPEAAQTPTPASDFYALGVLLYQLIFNPDLHDSSDAEAPEKWSFKGENRDLEPLIRQLLDRDPVYRIRNLDQFNRALRQCGVQLPVSALSVAKAKQFQSSGTEAGKMASRATPKWILPVVGLALAALAGILFVNLSSETAREATETQSQQIVASDNAKPAQVSDEQAPPPTETEPAEALPDPDSLYQQALSQLQLAPKAALDKVNLLLDQRPAYLEAFKLKRRIERELSARTLIARADRQLQELKLLQPSGDNAYESYQSLAELFSAEDERVQQGFTRIAAACHGGAERLLEEDLLDKAQETVELGLSIKTDYPLLLNLRMRIEERKSARERKKILLDSSCNNANNKKGSSWHVSGKRNNSLMSNNRERH